MRDFFRRYRTAILAITLMLCSMLLYSVNLKQRGATTLFERSVLTISTPLQNVIDAFSNGIYDTWSNYIWLLDTRQENLALTEINRKLKARLHELEEVRLQNSRLHKLLDFVAEEKRPSLPAQVVAEDSSNWARTIVLNKGTRDGLREGLPVVVSEGVVGRVIKTAPNSCRVLLITDASSAVAALVQSTRTRGVARGLGDSLTLDYALREEELRPGELLVTSGMGGVFPKGLVIGLVDRVEKGDFGLFQEVEVKPSADFSHLEEVLVLLEHAQ